MKYVILLDVDGTLVVPNSFALNEKIKKSFVRLKKDGHIIAIVTGRSLSSVCKVKGLENASYISGLMGQVIMDCKSNKLVKTPQNMDSTLVKAFVKDVESLGFEWTYKDNTQQKTYYLDLLNKYTTGACTKEEYASDLAENKICQLLVDEDVPQNIKEKYPMFDFFYMPGNYTDVIIKGKTKAEAVKSFRDMFPDYTIVAIGDSHNDIGMLETADISIAMGNASADIKALCTYTTTSLAENGVVYAFENILKI